MGTNNKLREALTRILNLTNSLDENCAVDPVEIRDIAKAALAEPIRNYEVGTAEEQAYRFHAFCMAHQSPIEGMCDSLCPCHEHPDKCHCMTAWAQLPYTEGGAK